MGNIIVGLGLIMFGLMAMLPLWVKWARECETEYIEKQIAELNEDIKQIYKRIKEENV